MLDSFRAKIVAEKSDWEKAERKAKTSHDLTIARANIGAYQYVLSLLDKEASFDDKTTRGSQ